MKLINLKPLMIFLWAVLFLSHPALCAEYELKFGGWSYHGESYEKDTYEYNEDHRGIGLEVFFPSDWALTPVVGAWTMEDSFNKRMVQVGGGFRYEPGFFQNRVSAQLMVVVERRGFNEVTESTGRSDGIYMDTNVIAIPYIQIKPFPKVGLAADFIYIPRFDSLDVETYFFRFSLSDSILK